MNTIDKTRWVKPLAIALGILALVVWGRGLYQFYGDGRDVEVRWKEAQLLLAGKDPNVFFDESIYESKKIPTHVSYPIASTILMVPFYAWPLPISRILIALAQLLGAVWVVRMLWKKNDDTWQNALSCLTVLGCSSLNTTLMAGNYGFLVTVFTLAWVRYVDSKPALARAGLFATVIKLSFTPLLVLPPLVRRDWRFVLSGLVLALVLLGGPLLLAGISPIRSGQTNIHQWNYAVAAGYSVANVLAVIGLPPSLWVPVGLFLLTGICLTMLLRFKDLTALEQMAVCAVGSRLWTYHQFYDNMIISILALALLQRLRARFDWYGLAAYLAVGATVWNPYKILRGNLMDAVHVLIWVSAAGFLALRSQRSIPEENYEYSGSERRASG